MQMPREIITPILPGVLNIMNKSKRSHPQDPFLHPDPSLLIPVRPQDIMIAHHQSDPEIRKILPPPQEKIEFLVLPRMEQISDDYKLIRLEILDQRQ